VSTDARCLPVVDLEIDEIRTLLAPLLGDARVASASRVDGGLVNTVYRVIAEGRREPLALRVYASGVGAFDKERRILSRVRASVPLPEIALTIAAGPTVPFPCVVYRWVDGITLNDSRRQFGPAALLSLAEPLGRLLADVAGISVEAEVAPPVAVSAALADADDRLRGGLARSRLGGALADALRARLDSVARLLDDTDRTRGLAHGDLGGRNIIVAPTGDGAWRVAALLDWEHAFAGAMLWDVGSLFRYARRYSSTFRDRFALAYRRAGGALPDDWHRLARLLDATRVVRIVSEERDLPVVFGECRKVIEALVREE
jgi:aminoglycoside phosphotransferase (APT) family kinase protein